MVYEMMRAMAGPLLCSVTDSYLTHQDVLNSVVVAGGFAWRVYDQKYRKHIKANHEKKRNFFGMEILEKR